MDSKEYIQNAIRTESVPEKIVINELMLGATMRLAVLTGSLMDQVKRRIFYGKEMDNQHIAALAHTIATGAALLVQASTHSDLNQPSEDDNGIHMDQLNIRLLHAGQGCFTESAELIEALHKQLATGEPLDKVNFGEEIGDIEWYQAIGYDESGVSEEECRQKNIGKLKKRYPEKFDAGQAVNRDLAAERAVLEAKSAPEAK